MSRRAQLRVGVDASLTRLGPRSGHGRVWRSVLHELGSMVDLQALDDPGARVPRRSRVDVLLGDGHAFPADSKRPLVVAVHEASWTQAATRDTIDAAFADHIAAATAAAVTAARAVIAPSQSSRQQVLDLYGLPEKRVHLVPYGVDSAVFRPGPARAGRDRVAAVLGADRPYVLFAATVHPRKNLPVLRDAMACLVDEGRPHALALVVSPTADRADSSTLLDEAIADLPGTTGRVAHLSALDDAAMAEVMSSCDVFCLPSAMEGFGLGVLEAMATGAPVVVADRGSLPEVVGDAGVLVEPTVDAVATAIRDLLDNDGRRARLSIAARHRAEQLSWQQTAAGWFDVLTAVAG